MRSEGNARVLTRDIGHEVAVALNNLRSKNILRCNGVSARFIISGLGVADIQEAVSKDVPLYQGPYCRPMTQGNG